MSGSEFASYERIIYTRLRFCQKRIYNERVVNNNDLTA